MADILLDVESNPTTPASGKAVLYFNTTTKALTTVNDAGLRRSYGMVNFSVAAQSPTAAARTYLTGSSIVFPAGTMQPGTMFRWTFDLTKTAAGVAASTFDIAFGTAGTTADTARVSFTKPAGTAVADEGFFQIVCIIRTIGATGVAVGQFHMTHNLQITGHAIIPSVDVNTVSAGFDMTTVTTVGLCVTSGAADAITSQLVIAEALNV